jgi:hypothetical protein
MNNKQSTTQWPSTGDKHRWYLCKESVNVGHWICESSPPLTAENMNGRTIVVPVPQWLPSAVDFMFINNALKPKFTVVSPSDGAR